MKKILMLFAVVLFVVSPNFVSAATLSDLEVRIMSLEKQMTSLQAQIQTLIDLNKLKTSAKKSKKTSKSETIPSYSIQTIAGQQLCYGKKVKIVWDKSKFSTDDSISLLLQLPQTNASLSSVRASAGEYLWDIKEKHITPANGGLGGSFTVQESDLYRVFLQSTKNPAVSSATQSGFFEVKKCQ